MEHLSQAKEPPSEFLQGISHLYLEDSPTVPSIRELAFQVIAEHSDLRFSIPSYHHYYRDLIEVSEDQTARFRTALEGLLVGTGTIVHIDNTPRNPDYWRPPVVHLNRNPGLHWV